MGLLRALVRFSLLALVSLAFYLLWLAAAAPLVGRWRRRRIRLRRWIMRRWGRAFLAVVGARVESRGEAPETPFVLVSNHLGYLDIPLLAAAAGGVFVAKREIAGWPVVGTFCRGVGVIFVDRTSRRDIPRVLARIEETLAEGDGVILFPEGTSTPGDEVAPFRPSLLEAPARGRLPVSYAAVTYRTPGNRPPARTAVCWWGDMSFLDHLWRLTRLPWIEATITFGREPVTGADRKRLAAELHRAVAALHEPIAPAVAAR